MGPIRGLWRDTWWLWLAFTLAVILLAAFVMTIFVVLLPVIAGMFLSFAFGRYDKDGNEKPGFHG